MLRSLCPSQPRSPELGRRCWPQIEALQEEVAALQAKAKSREDAARAAKEALYKNPQAPVREERRAKALEPTSCLQCFAKCPF